MKITFYGDEYPATFAVCPRCDGTGTHVNPSIDANGLTCADFDEAGPQFYGDYMRGAYDVRCEECHGQRVVAVLDRDSCTPEQLERVKESERDIAEMHAIAAAERRMGA